MPTPPRSRRGSRRSPLLGCVALGFAVTFAAGASDHLDTQELFDRGRADVTLTDLYAFTDGEGAHRTLVLAAAVDPGVDPAITAESYAFPLDLVLTLRIDRDSEVELDDPVHPQLGPLGGTVVHPAAIEEDFEIEITFDDGSPEIDSDLEILAFFAGLRDDPFIFEPRNGRNVGAVVIAVALDEIVDDARPLLIWATTHIDGHSDGDSDGDSEADSDGDADADHDQDELVGRGMYSQFAEFDLVDRAINTLHPHRHASELGERPAVLIYDTSRPASWPNGRPLEDDVVDPILPDLDPDNDVNDLPFLVTFPYLAAPHPPGGG